MTSTVFLSYSSEDAKAAARIADALKAAGVEVWFDKSELRGGDTWDRNIRQQIRSCRLFIPVISANTETRAEGYFRREWKLAVERTYDMSERTMFLVPVVIDGTHEATADVPDAFKSVQWTHLPGGETPPSFVTRVSTLLASRSASISNNLSAEAPAPLRRPAGPRSYWLASVSLAVALAALGAWGLWHSHKGSDLKRSTGEAAPAPAQPATLAASFNPPPHSVAVLPFENLSPDADQKYFSDGLAEDILNSLAHVESLKVAAKTSAFALGQDGRNVSSIARQLNVGTVLQGSVQHVGRRVRVTTQLIDARSGYQLWSDAFDEPFLDILRVQSTIARQVAAHLDSKLSGLALAKLAEGETRNIDAYDTFLRGIHLLSAAVDDVHFAKAASTFERAIAFDPKYAAAYAMLAHARTVQFTLSEHVAERRHLSEGALIAADKAVALAPDLPEAYATRGFVHTVALLDFGDAADFDKAMTLAPNNALVLARKATYDGIIGHQEEALINLRRAIDLDPLNVSWRQNFILNLFSGRKYREALNAIDANEKSAGAGFWIGTKGDIFIVTGDAARAQELCLSTLSSGEPQYKCLAIAAHALGRESEAERYYALSVQKYGDEGSFIHAEICVQLEHKALALEWLRKAVAVRDPTLQHLRRSPYLDPIRHEAAYRAIEKELHFPPDA